jgi:hypothetical protein
MSSVLWPRALPPNSSIEYLIFFDVNLGLDLHESFSGPAQDWLTRGIGLRISQISTPISWWFARLNGLLWSICFPVQTLPRIDGLTVSLQLLLQQLFSLQCPPPPPELCSWMIPWWTNKRSKFGRSGTLDSLLLDVLNYFNWSMDFAFQPWEFTSRHHITTILYNINSILPTQQAQIILTMIS